MPKIGTPISVRQNHLLDELMLRSNSFLNGIVKLQVVLGLSNQPIKRYAQATSSEKGKLIHEGWLEKAKENRVLFLKKSSDSQIKNFLAAVEAIRKAHGLGKEWDVSIIDMILSNYFRPPGYNFFLEIDEYRKTLKIEFNPSTTLEDINTSKDVINAARKQVFGDVRKKYFTKKSPENLLKVYKSEQLKLKDRDLSDLDIVGRLFPDEGLTPKEKDQLRVKQLRVLRYRSKKNSPRGK